MTHGNLLGTWLKLGAFLVITLLCTALVTNTLHRPLGQATTTYQAEFTDVVGLTKGSDVRIAGVRVGKVDRIELTGKHATVTFEVTDDQHVPADAEADLRFADLLGARYLAVQPGGGSSAEMEPGTTIPLERTSPAVDLTELFNGFAPVFESLQPAEVNELAGKLVAVFDGQGGTLDSLLSHLVSVTENLVDQDEVIGEVLANLRSATDFALEHEPEFERLVNSLAELAAGMADSAEEIGAAIDGAGELARSVSGLMTEMREPLESNIASLDSITETFVEQNENFAATLDAGTEMLPTVNRTLEYGAWLNVYVCFMTIETELPLVGEVDPGVGPHSEVCRT
ncbi:phospholipid/cholesterol/gamma-HCH transport system substrate-binding protein [Haloechinothrix alba]|uniref:Phospholipid/cholesterol/gamma-HCH transport system substrate-binding protein n=1 Tax=Haloechinothrix alba TaxID=664784 RepID=A0A238WPI8_9PSEU|nr:MCE family protein [Haloechinothrix alba]SNR48233.1 phospholipid/cholesterol/gamma-HCH transport system substrate-binding protein [Haloechinothrix alba]